MRILAGKKAVVTGGAAGIGKAIALALARERVSVCLIDIDAVRLAGTAAEIQRIGVEAITECCDLANPAQVSAAVSAVVRQWGNIDLLVNNAGIATLGPTEKMTPLAWDRLLAINLRAPIQLVSEFLPTLLTQTESHIINVCSIAGLVAFRELTAYCTSKFALVGFSAALRSEFRSRGVGVTAVCPGFVRTDLLRTARADGRVPPNWMCISPDQVARRVVRAVRVNQGLVVMPAWAKLLWLAHRYMPGLLRSGAATLRIFKKWKRAKKELAAPPRVRNHQSLDR